MFAKLICLFYSYLAVSHYFVKLYLKVIKVSWLLEIKKRKNEEEKRRETKRRKKRREEKRNEKCTFPKPVVLLTFATFIFLSSRAMYRREKQTRAFIEAFRKRLACTYQRILSMC